MTSNVASTHLQHILLAGFLLGGPTQRRPPQVYCELRDDLIGLVLRGKETITDPRGTVQETDLLLQPFSQEST